MIKNLTKNSFNFTKDTLTKIKIPDTKQVVYKDSKEAGLFLIVSYGGSKTFYLLGKKINGNPRKFKIGRFPDVTICEARAKAMDLKNQIAMGIDPAEKYTKEPAIIENTELTFEQLIDKYINDYAKHAVKRWKDIIADMDRQAKHLYELKISTITRDDIQKIFNDLTAAGKKVMANKCVGRFTGIFNRAIEWELLDKNPALGIKKHKEKSRDRYLVSEEKPNFFQVLDEEPNQIVKDFILVSLYTGARKSNILAMRWDEVSLNDRVWRIPDTKNGDPHLLPLTVKVMQILEERNKHRNSNSVWVFPSLHNSKSGHLEDPKRAWNKIRQKAGLKDFRLHDLRRTTGSWMAISGASQYVIGKTLNHKSPKSTAIYARLSIDPVREFMEKANSIFDKNT